MESIRISRITQREYEYGEVTSTESNSSTRILCSFNPMGNVLSDDGVTDHDMNGIKEITLETPYPANDPIWKEVFEMKGYLQSISRAYLYSATTTWSHAMRRNTERV